MLKILITGADGQLGYDFKKLFDSLGINYIATDYKELDIINTEQLNKFFLKNKNFSHIINCAAYNNVDKAEKDKKVNLLNIEAPKNLAEISKKLNAVFVTYSTDFVFDGKQKIPYNEEDIPNPLSEYGKTKLQGEKEVIRTYDKSFIIRTSWLFGVGNNNFCKQVINWSKTKKILKIVDDQISSPTYSKDLAFFSWKLIQTEKFGIYHISNNGEASKYEQAKYILNKIGWGGALKKGKTKDFDLFAERPEYSKLSSEKIEKLLGERMPVWQNAIDRFFQEMKEKGEL